MQNIVNSRGLPTDVKDKIDAILSKHKISTQDNLLNTSIKSTNFFDNNSMNTIDREIKLDPSKTIMSKTDTKGIIEYANDYFMEISGYDEFELMGQPHNIIRHPDMPKVIFKELWTRLKKGENIHALVKNRSKDGGYYWVLTNFETKFDENGKAISHYARRKAAPAYAVFKVEKLYKTLLAIEKNQSTLVAERYFKGLLEENNTNYDGFILSILGIDSKSLSKYFDTQNSPSSTTTSKNKKKGIISRLFGK